MRVLVVTTVHHPQDARIRQREIAALLDGGWSVTYAAPFSGYGLDPAAEDPRLTVVDLPRARGRRRLRALGAARRTMRRAGRSHDVILVHDPELLLAAAGIRRPPVVLDVHEDTAAAVTLKPWLPRALRGPVRSLVTALERVAERRHPLLLAEHAYAARFRRPHPVVPNAVRVPAQVPPPDRAQAVYVGHVSAARGCRELVRTAHALHAATEGRLRLVVVGHADAWASQELRRASQEGVLDWTGFLPTREALEVAAGSVAGLSLLHDEPNYRDSMPTKVVEYMGLGLPVVTTPLPLARELVEESGCGVVVPFGDADAAAEAVLALDGDRDRRLRCSAAGRETALRRFDWAAHAPAFVAELARVAASGAARRAAR